MHIIQITYNRKGQKPYIKLKNSQNSFMVTEFRVVVLLGLMGRDQKRTSWGTGNVPHLEMGGDVMVIHTRKNPLNCTLQICILYYM